MFPSRFEGLGMAAVEAQAAGLPVVCSEAIPQEARRHKRRDINKPDGTIAACNDLREDFLVF